MNVLPKSATRAGCFLWTRAGMKVLCETRKALQMGVGRSIFWLHLAT
jgi:hypothetical protein